MITTISIKMYLFSLRHFLSIIHSCVNPQTYSVSSHLFIPSSNLAILELESHSHLLCFLSLKHCVDCSHFCSNNWLSVACLARTKIYWFSWHYYRQSAVLSSSDYRHASSFPFSHLFIDLFIAIYPEDFNLNALCCF